MFPMVEEALQGKGAGDIQIGVIVKGRKGEQLQIPLPEGPCTQFLFAILLDKFPEARVVQSAGFKR